MLAELKASKLYKFLTKPFGCADSKCATSAVDQKDAKKAEEEKGSDKASLPS